MTVPATLVNRHNLILPRKSSNLHHDVIATLSTSTFQPLLYTIEALTKEIIAGDYNRLNSREIELSELDASGVELSRLLRTMCLIRDKFMKGLKFLREIESYDLDTSEVERSRGKSTQMVRLPHAYVLDTEASSWISLWSVPDTRKPWLVQWHLWDPV
ncbi:hypothetical protein ElyMa_005734100 [Elysia marginata]|uniref:Uncharacterized protein n=1 Tax=Elysia marginata TaxID=1093978 RepID=A0AAV4FLJ9_9GAST|nr:hypothetical protein ElyMa_005734100 [Elysia marginata]